MSEVHPAATIERRQFLRYPCSIATTMRFGGLSESTWPAHIRNISAGGLGLVCDAKCNVGKGVTMSVELPELHEAQVVHTSLTDTAAMLIGAAFVDGLDAQQVVARFLPDQSSILLVEEERSVREMLDLAMSNHGLRVWPVGSGREALAVFKHHRRTIGLVLLDIGMKAMDGPQTLALLQQIDPALHCWFMTGGAEKYTDAELARLPAQRILHKPLDLDVLLPALVKMVGQ